VIHGLAYITYALHPDDLLSSLVFFYACGAVSRLFLL